MHSTLVISWSKYRTYLAPVHRWPQINHTFHNIVKQNLINLVDTFKLLGLCYVLHLVSCYYGNGKSASGGYIYITSFLWVALGVI